MPPGLYSVYLKKAIEYLEKAKAVADPPKAQVISDLIRFYQTGDLKARPGMPWGLAFCVIEDPSQMEGNRHFNPGTFGHGGAFGTQSWADPATGLVYVFMIQRDKIPNNPDNSPMRRAYQDAVAAAIKSP